MRYHEFKIVESLVLLEARVDVLRQKYISNIESKKQTLTIPDDIKSNLLTNNELDANKIFDWIVSKDPTNKKIYSQWLLDRILRKKQPIPFEDVEYAPEIFARYEEMKKNNTLPVEARDINRFRTLSELQEKIKTGENIIQQASDAEKQRAIDESEILQDSSNWLVLIPKTEYAAQYWGKDTEWCTAWGGKIGKYQDRTCQFNEYAQDYGNIYTYIHKTDTSENRQIQPASDQYMDHNDIDFDWVTWVKRTPEIQKVSKKIAKYEFEKRNINLKTAISLDAINISDPKVQLAAVTQNSLAIKYILNQGIEPSEEVQLAAVTQNGSVIYNIFRAGVKPSEEVRLAAVTQNGRAIRYILEQGIKPSERVQLAAVTQYGDVIRYILDRGIKPSEQVQLAAVTQDGSAIADILDAVRYKGLPLLPKIRDIAVKRGYDML